MINLGSKGLVGVVFVMKKNAYVPEDRNEGGRVATPTRFSIFDSYVMKSYLHWIQNGKSLNLGFPFFSYFMK